MSAMEVYLNEKGIRHRPTSPLWPRANGEVKRQNRSFVKAMSAAHAERRDLRLEINKFFLAFLKNNFKISKKLKKANEAALCVLYL